MRGLISCGADYLHFTQDLEGSIYDELRTKSAPDRYAAEIWPVKYSKLVIALRRLRWRILIPSLV